MTDNCDTKFNCDIVLDVYITLSAIWNWLISMLFLYELDKLRKARNTITVTALLNYQHQLNQSLGLEIIYTHFFIRTTFFGF
jgi:hypothetical protein